MFKRIKRSKLAGFVLVFGSVASVIVIVTQAAGTPIAFEAETGTLGNGAATVSNASASNGQAVKFAQSGGQTGACTGAAPAAYTYNYQNGRSWPTAYGQSYIATWKDDKIAATTLTIDDNIAGDHTFWKQKAQETGFKFTWFVVTGQDANGKLMTGATWNDFRALYALGHSIQSHTVTHSSPITNAEFSQSQIDIEREIGVKPLTVAYPDGDSANQAGAAQYYIAGRGTTGWLNSYQPDYMDINSFSSDLNTTSPNNYNYAPAVLDKSFTGDTSVDFYRGWISIHYHSISGDEAIVQSHLDWLKAREADIWIAGFDHVAAYAKERDAAGLSVTAAGTNCVAFNVTDTLPNATFKEPLTVKVRLQDTADWSAVSAKQNGQPVTARIVTNGTAKYALVEAVPDAGTVTVYNPGFN